MAVYTASAYKANPNASVNVNADHGWGGYQWPKGVPASLLGYAEFEGIRIQVRKELTELFSLALAIAKRKHGYTVYTKNPNGSGENWGPWGYENRPIGGGSTPSNHSKGKASDWNAPYNAYASGFSTIRSDFPPAMVADLESIGLCWGGRYGDAMHWEYGYSPADVAGHVAKARLILATAGVGSGSTTTITPAPVRTADQIEEDELMSRVDELLAAVNRLAAAVEDLPTKIWIKGITGEGPGQHANELLAAAAVNAGVAASAVTTETNEIDQRLADLPTILWTKKITDQGANELLVELVTRTQQLQAAVAIALDEDHPAPEPNPDPEKAATYTVVANDTFGGIAKKANVTLDALAAVNPQVTDPNVIQVGQVLNLPK